MTSSKVEIRLIAEVRKYYVGQHPVQILCSLHEPKIECRCGKKVTTYYTKCTYNDAISLCRECAKKANWIKEVNK